MFIIFPSLMHEAKVDFQWGLVGLWVLFICWFFAFHGLRANQEPSDAWLRDRIDKVSIFSDGLHFTLSWLFELRMSCSYTIFLSLSMERRRGDSLSIHEWICLHLRLYSRILGNSEREHRFFRDNIKADMSKDEKSGRDFIWSARRLLHEFPLHEHDSS